jgi:hypothetical protein
MIAELLHLLLAGRAREPSPAENESFAARPLGYWTVPSNEARAPQLATAVGARERTDVRDADSTG